MSLTTVSAALRFILQNAGGQRDCGRAQERRCLDGDIAQRRSISQCQTHERESRSGRQVSATDSVGELLYSGIRGSVHTDSTGACRHGTTAGRGSKGKRTGAEGQGVNGSFPSVFSRKRNCSRDGRHGMLGFGWGVVSIASAVTIVALHELRRSVTDSQWRLVLPYPIRIESSNLDLSF